MSEDFRPEITALQVNIHRGIDGLVLVVKANEKIENYFKGISQGRIEDFDLRVAGKMWLPKDGSNSLKLYQISHENGLNGALALPNSQGSIRSYRLDTPGRRLLEYDPMTGVNSINISFLRMEGISKDGFSFQVKGVYSPAQVREIYDGILAAVSSFCSMYLSTINLTINLVES